MADSGQRVLRVCIADNAGNGNTRPCRPYKIRGFEEHLHLTRNSTPVRDWKRTGLSRKRSSLSNTDAPVQRRDLQRPTSHEHSTEPTKRESSDALSWCDSRNYQPARHRLHALRRKHRLQPNGIHPRRFRLRHLLPARGSHLPHRPTAQLRSAHFECASDNILAQYCSRELRSVADWRLHDRSGVFGPDDTCHLNRWNCSIQARRAEGEETRTL